MTFIDKFYIRFCLISLVVPDWNGRVFTRWKANGHNQRVFLFFFFFGFKHNLGFPRSSLISDVSLI